MAKPEGWRLDAASYPVTLSTATRFQDLDPNGHLNNVAFAALFENARVQMNRHVRPISERPAGERTLVAQVNISYLREGSYPEPVIIHSGVGAVGTSSWTILQCMIQHDRCIALCDTVVVCREAGAAKPLRSDVRATLAAIAVTRQ